MEVVDIKVEIELTYNGEENTVEDVTVYFSIFLSLTLEIFCLKMCNDHGFVMASLPEAHPSRRIKAKTVRDHLNENLRRRINSKTIVTFAKKTILGPCLVSENFEQEIHKV